MVARRPGRRPLRPRPQHWRAHAGVALPRCSSCSPAEAPQPTAPVLFPLTPAPRDPASAGSNLTGVQFARAQAQGADLRGADFTDVNAFSTAFDGADLEVRAAGRGPGPGRTAHPLAQGWISQPGVARAVKATRAAR